MKKSEFNTDGVDDTYTHPSGNNSELVLLEMLANDSEVDLSPINISARNLTVQTTFRLSMKIDGTNYDLRNGSAGTIVWNPGDGPWIRFDTGGITDHDVKVTIQSGGAGEPSPVDVPYSYNGAR